MFIDTYETHEQDSNKLIKIGCNRLKSMVICVQVTEKAIDMVAHLVTQVVEAESNRCREEGVDFLMADYMVSST